MTRDDFAAKAYGLLLAGHDTMAVAARMKMPESQASRLVWIGRAKAKGLPGRFINHNGALSDVNPMPQQKSA